MKEVSRRMARPRKKDWVKLKRLGRYIVGRPRVVTVYPMQSACKEVTCWTDTDYAGCKETRKSTSGGGIQVGKHILKKLVIHPAGNCIGIR